jgi:hypothetical protein
VRSKVLTEMPGKSFSYFLFGAYALLLAITLLNHEMWRDELQPWGIVTHSASFQNLLSNIKYEGHPILWFAILWITSKIAPNPFSIQLINYILSLCTIAIVVFKSPFSAREKMLIIFGYYFFYEYAAISRDYMLAMLFIFSICALLKDEMKHRNLMAVLFFILCFTEIYASIFSVCFAAVLGFYPFFAAKEKYDWKNMVIPAAAITGFCLSYFATVPPADSGLNYPITWTFNGNHAVRVLGDFWNAFIPIPKFQEHFWSSSLLYETDLAALLGVALMATVLVGAFPDKKLFLLLLTSFCGILAFMYFKYSGYPRHFGHLFIIYLCYQWMRRYSFPSAAAAIKPVLSTVFFNVVLVINMVVGISFAVADWILPFSSGKATAEFITQHIGNDAAIAGYEDCPATTVANYLHKDIYLLNNFRQSSWIVFTNDRPLPNDKIILQHIFQLADSLQSLTVILNHKPDIDGRNPFPVVGNKAMLKGNTMEGIREFEIDNLAYFGNSMAGGESFYVYKISMKK